MKIQDTLQSTISSLDKRAIYNKVKFEIETVNLSYMTNPEGFKIYYDRESGEPSFIYYYYDELSPYHHMEKLLTGDEFDKVREWLKI